MFGDLRAIGFQIEFHSHAEAILSVDFPLALEELSEVLKSSTIPIKEIVGSGGGESKGTQRLRRALAEKQWVKVKFEIKKTINNIQRESISHEVDHVRTFPDNRLIALEIEWNNKDPFFDRDLENFKRLHAEGAISVGVIITRGTSLQQHLGSMVLKYANSQGFQDLSDLEREGLNPTPRQRAEIVKRTNRNKSFSEAWAEHFVADKFGSSTTHWGKLKDRVHRGVGNPCPLLLIGMPDAMITFE